MIAETAGQKTLKPLTVSIDQLIAKADDLAALPQVVMRVIDMTVDPKATAADLEKVIGTDQALAARILTLANSSYYGLPRRISSLREAVVFLGFKSVRSLAMTITTFNLFLGKSDALSLARRALWRHSLDAAQCARVITSLLHPTDREAFGSDEAFTCGLLHDIGKMILDIHLHETYTQIMALSEAHRLRFHDIEDQVLPFNHGLVGAALAARWNLPSALCETIAFHHTPRAGGVNPKLTATISLANEVGHFLETGRKEADWELLLERTEEARFTLRLSTEALQAMTSACRAELDKGLSALAFH